MLATKQELLSHIEFLKYRIQQRMNNYLSLTHNMSPELISEMYTKDLDRINFFDSMKENYR